MAWFQLAPLQVKERIAAYGAMRTVPSLGASVLRGTLGFTVVSILGFAPWAVAGGWFYRTLGEAGLYIVCALVFIGAAGPLLHPLIIGPGSLPRFYKLFTVSFTAYAVAWIIGWMALGGHIGSIVGLLAGTCLMGWMLARAFDADREAPKVIAALFLLNAAGYFLGGVLEAAVARANIPALSPGPQLVLAKTLWGVCYGFGFGAGLGGAFYLCQERTRALLRTTPSEADPAA